MAESILYMPLYRLLARCSGAFGAIGDCPFATPLFGLRVSVQTRYDTFAFTTKGAPIALRVALLVCPIWC